MIVDCPYCGKKWQFHHIRDGKTYLVHFCASEQVYLAQDGKGGVFMIPAQEIHQNPPNREGCDG